MHVSGNEIRVDAGPLYPHHKRVLNYVTAPSLGNLIQSREELMKTTLQRSPLLCSEGCGFVKHPGL